MSVLENKISLESFLSKDLLIKAEDLEHDKELVVAGGLENPHHVISSSGQDMKHLYSSHEEADTRIVLHTKDASENCNQIMVHSRDMDVLALLVAHDIGADVWMSEGLAKKPRYIPVNSIRQTLSPHVVGSI